MIFNIPDGSVVKILLAMQETWVWALGQEDPLKKEMAIHSSILAWEIPWTQGLMGYSPWGCRRARQDWATKTTRLTRRVVKHPFVMQEMQVQSLGPEVPRRRKWQHTPVVLPEEFHGQRILVGYSPWGHKEPDTTKHSIVMCVCV